MSKNIKVEGRKCCSLEHDRLLAELDTCDQIYKNPSDWHRCARVIARRSGQRVRRCILQE